MLTDILFGVLATVLYIIAYPFSLISYVMPSGVTTAISYFAGYLLYWRGVLPIDTLLSICQALLQFFGFYYGIKIITWALAYLPWINHTHANPTVSTNSGK